MLEVKRYTTKEEAAEAAAWQVSQIFKAHSHIPMLFLSSGGSSLQLLDSIKGLPPNLTVGVTDERFSENPKVNNFAQFCETSFFQKAQEQNAYFIDTRVQAGEDIEMLSKRFEGALHDWKEEYPGGRVVITQGVGADSHTIGIMPYPRGKDVFQGLFDTEERWVQGYEVQGESDYPLRITLTFPFLRMVDHCVVYMIGKEKQKALSLTLKAEGNLWEIPSRIIHEMKEVTLFTNIQE